MNATALKPAKRPRSFAAPHPIPSGVNNAIRPAPISPVSRLLQHFRGRRLVLTHEVYKDGPRGTDFFQLITPNLIAVQKRHCATP
jgi:hypothetical protein